MKKEYDFSKMKGRKNPYIKLLKKPITIRIESDTIHYFKTLADDTGLPYQNLINLYLRECALEKRKPEIIWSKSA